VASVRLTNEIRDEIKAAVLRHRFGKELAGLVKDRAKFARAVYDNVFSTADRKRMNDLPDGWLPSTGSVAFKAATTYVDLNLSGRFSGELNSSLPPTKGDDRVWLSIPTNRKNGCLVTYEADHLLAIRWAELEAAFRDIEARHREAKSQLSAALAKASTMARLIELWPEMAPFCKPYEAVAPSLPSIPTSRLNALLDLPVSEAA
jgi:hypothetical protein